VDIPRFGGSSGAAGLRETRGWLRKTAVLTHPAGRSLGVRAAYTHAGVVDGATTRAPPQARRPERSAGSARRRRGSRAVPPGALAAGRGRCDDRVEPRRRRRAAGGGPTVAAPCGRAVSHARRAAASADPRAGARAGVRCALDGACTTSRKYRFHGHNCVATQSAPGFGLGRVPETRRCLRALAIGVAAGGACRRARGAACRSRHPLRQGSGAMVPLRGGAARGRSAAVIPGAASAPRARGSTVRHVRSGRRARDRCGTRRGRIDRENLRKMHRGNRGFLRSRECRGGPHCGDGAADRPGHQAIVDKSGGAAAGRGPGKPRLSDPGSKQPRARGLGTFNCAPTATRARSPGPEFPPPPRRC
jgi:hypothetical protein